MTNDEHDIREDDVEADGEGAAAEDQAATAPEQESGMPEGAGDAEVDAGANGIVGDDPETEPTAETADEGEAVGGLQADYDALNDRHLRLAAEFNNYRRRSEQERLAAWARAQADLLAKFLDVLDDLHRVADLDLSNATVEAIMEGIDLVEKKFVGVLADSDVQIIDPAGQPFDPEIMEAMMRVPAETPEQADTVAQVFQKGYSIKETLVRPARVSVFTE